MGKGCRIWACARERAWRSSVWRIPHQADGWPALWMEMVSLHFSQSCIENLPLNSLVQISKSRQNKQSRNFFKTETKFSTWNTGCCRCGDILGGCGSGEWGVYQSSGWWFDHQLLQSACQSILVQHAEPWCIHWSLSVYVNIRQGA